MVGKRVSYRVVLLAVAAALWACGDAVRDGADDDGRTRDLRLAPADSTFALNDEPLATPESEPIPDPPEQPEAAPNVPQQPTLTLGSIDKPRPEKTLTMDVPMATKPATGGLHPRSASTRLGSGTYMTVKLREGVSSKRNEVGDAVSATVAEDMRNAEGDVVIPAGAVLRGRISKIEKNGRHTWMSLAFEALEIDGVEHSIAAAAFNVRGRREKRGPSAGDVAKAMGAGALIGGLVGGAVSDGSGDGVAIGAAAGAVTNALGVSGGYDVVLDAGQPVDCVLTGPFQAQPLILRSF